MLFGIGSAPKYGNSFPIIGIPRLDGLTIIYVFLGNKARAGEKASATGWV